MADTPKVLRFPKANPPEPRPPHKMVLPPHKMTLALRKTVPPPRKIVLPPPEPPPRKMLRQKSAEGKAGQDSDVVFSSQRYTILKTINEGGMGTVCRAWDTVLKMDVAIKMLKPEIARDKESVAQLKSYASVAMKLSHENIVRLHNIEIEKGHIFLVMEYVEGQTLRAISQHMGPLALPAVLDIAHACNEALTYAHGRGVLHRDIKPDNLMVNDAFVLKIVDFGIALKMAHHDDGQYLEGSPGYVSPEQVQGRPLDARTDIFSLAVVLCELMTGRRAFPKVADLGHMYDHEPVGIETIPAPVAEVLQKGMARDIGARWRTVAEFYNALSHAIIPLMG